MKRSLSLSVSYYLAILVTDVDEILIKGLSSASSGLKSDHNKV